MIAIMCSMYTSDRIFLNRSWFRLQKGAAVKGALANSRCSLRNGIAGSSLSPRIGNKRIVLFTEQNAVQCIKRRMLRGDRNGLQQRTTAEGVMVEVDNRIGKGYGCQGEGKRDGVNACDAMTVQHVRNHDFRVVA